ncbi:MAG: hypothetical protein LC657_03240 [Desulfobacteraceae bacterium]|nr:hypothetical protein [Desulfobacteraceae bacterium]
MEASENVININSVIESNLKQIVEQIEKTGRASHQPAPRHRQTARQCPENGTPGA